MNNRNRTLIFLVDDDALFLGTLELEFLEEPNFIIKTFLSGELCLQSLSDEPDIIVLDYLLDGMNKSAMNGLDTLDQIKAINPNIPVIMLSAQDKIEVAVNCLHHKAIDYVVKSETAFIRVKKIIFAILEYKKMEKELNWYMDKM